MSTGRAESPKGQAVKEVKISAELMEKLDNVPDSDKGATRRGFTPEEDAILMQYWEAKNKEWLAKTVLKCSVNTARKRYRELTQ